MNRQPLVSIVIPVYNGANYAAEAIESALAQTYSNIEILVINDGSTDEGATDSVVGRYLDRVKYIKKDNGGVATAMNLGIREMRGEYFSWLSHDDLYLPNKIQAQVDFLSALNFPEVVVYSNHYDLIESTQAISLTRHAERADLAFRAREIVANNQVHGCSLLVPRKAFDTVGIFNEELRVAQDYDLWFRIAAVFPFRWLDAAVATCRVHDKQVGVRLHDRVLIENDHFRLNCLKQLNEAEVAALGRGQLSLGLLYLALRMYRMGCPAAHGYLLGELKRMVVGRPRNWRQSCLATISLGVDKLHTTALQGIRQLRNRRQPQNP